MHTGIRELKTLFFKHTQDHQTPRSFISSQVSQVSQGFLRKVPQKDKTINMSMDSRGKRADKMMDRMEFK